MRTKINAVLCVHCLGLVTSLHDHDMQGCNCDHDHRVCVDGGSSYKRRVHGEHASWIEIDNLEELESVPGLLLAFDGKGKLS